jgi:Uncharacterized protein conserved in bacteria (DUF2345)/Domain of unknown function (DUF4123)
VGVGDAVSLFVHRAGMKLFAARGKIQLQAHSDKIEITADKSLDLIAVTVNRFALIDSAQAEGFYRDIERKRLPCASLFEGHAEHSLIEIAPLLVKLPDEGTASSLQQAFPAGPVNDFHSTLTNQPQLFDS